MTLKQQLVEAVIKRVYSLLNEGRNADTAKRKTLEVIRNFFKNDTDSLSRIDYIEKKLKDLCFHANIPDAVIRLEPIIMNIALSLGFEQANPDTAKLNRLFRIVNSLPDLQRNEMLPEGIQLNQLNLENTTYDRLNDLFGSILDKQDAEEEERINKADYSKGINPNYEILSNIDYETAKEYGDYSCSDGPLCYTQDESTWEQYTNGGNNTVYLLLHKDWEDIPEEHGEDTPYDDYGLSMIFVFIDEEGNIAYSNTRWNHENDGKGPDNVDQSFTKAMLSNLLHIKFGEVFKPLHTIAEKLAKAKQQLQNGADPKDVFDNIDDFSNGFAIVKLGGKYNFIDINNNILSEDLWFDKAWKFHEGFAVVQLEDKYNFINADGNILRDDLWFDDIRFFSNGFVRVKLKNKYNIINTNGEPISALWFDGVDDFRNGFAEVKLENKINFINTNGELINAMWFDDVWVLSNGFAEVKLGSKWNFIDINKKILSKDLWFDNVGNFRNGFAGVKLENKINFIDTNGEIVSDLWFDEVDYSYNGFAKVRLGKKFNFIDTNKKILRDDLWFDEVRSFVKGFAEVKLGSKWNFIDTDGNILREDLWFDKVEIFEKGFAKVKLGSKYNFINTDGNLLRDDLWFDEVDDFDEGFAKVRLGNKYNFIKPDGNLLCDDLWFDEARFFPNGFAMVKLEKKYNLINTNGKIISDLWFDDIEGFGYGIPTVQLDGKSYYIDGKGNLYDIGSGKLIHKVNENRRRVVRLTESHLRNTIKTVITQYLNEGRRR